jgi:hypothetical protein
MKDAAHIVTKPLPAAGANNNTATLDTGAARTAPNGVLCACSGTLELTWPALPNLVDAKTVTFKVQDSADDSGYADLGLTWTLTGAGGAGVAAGSKRFVLPPDVRRYVQVNTAVAAAGGDSTAKSVSVAFLFGVNE